MMHSLLQLSWKHTGNPDLISTLTVGKSYNLSKKWQSWRFMTIIKMLHRCKFAGKKGSKFLKLLLVQNDSQKFQNTRLLFSIANKFMKMALLFYFVLKYWYPENKSVEKKSYKYCIQRSHIFTSLCTCLKMKYISLKKTTL